MSNLPNHDKSKDKKKSFVERLFYFASQTIRLNKKSERKKKSLGSKNKDLLDNTDGIIKVSSNSDMQTCTFCDYCDMEIVAEFKGQNIIYHEHCRKNHDEQFPVESAPDLEKSNELLTSIQSDIISPCTKSTVVNSRHSKMRLSTSLNDLSVSDSDVTMVTRRVRERSLGVDNCNNCLMDTETGTYTFSTVDLPTIKQYGISIKKVPSVEIDVAINDTRTNAVVTTGRGSFSRVSGQPISFSTIPEDDLKMMMEVFNNNDQGLFVESKNGQIMGKIRVFINLLRPIKMLLTARPPSTFDVYPESINYSNQSTIDRAYYNKEVIFWLPRGTTKLLYINIDCTTTEVISLLLAKFNIQNNPKKFALYQHTIKSPTEVEACKLKTNPLNITMGWCNNGVEYFHQNLETKKFVLQENDPGSIEWEEFSLPELQSFLKILKQEEDEKRNQILRKYEIIRSDIHRRITTKSSVKMSKDHAYL